MPVLLPFAPLIAALAGVAGVGTSIYEGVKSSDEQAANQAAQLKAQQAAAAQANLAKQEAVLGSQGQAQEQTGGSLTDSGTAALTDLLAGYPGYQAGQAGTGGTVAGGTTPTSAIAPTTLRTGGPGTGGTDSSGAIAAILAALRGGTGGAGGLGSPGTSTISGGNWQTQPPQPQAWNELANPPLG